jgi:hypothetical protein
MEGYFTFERTQTVQDALKEDDIEKKIQAYRKAKNLTIEF